MATNLPPDPDDQLFLLLQSMGYQPAMPLWQYQQWKRLFRWNPNTDRMEPFRYTDEQAASLPQGDASK